MTIHQKIQIGYWIALGALTLCVILRGSPAMKRTVYTLVAVLAISLVLSAVGNWTAESYAIAMMTVDAVAAAIILIRPAGRAQAVIGLTFLLQITIYLAR